MRISAESLIKDLGKVLDIAIAKQIVNSYVEMLKRFYSGDWKSSELDGGQFCESIARAILQLDSGIIETKKLPKEICDVLLDIGKPSGINHSLDRKDRNHLCKILQATYNFRSDRGVAHSSFLYIANLLDATLVISNVKWLSSDFIRIALAAEPLMVNNLVESIIQIEHPLIYEIDGSPHILIEGLGAKEEILLYLLNSPSNRLTKEELKVLSDSSPNAVMTAISRLCTKKHVAISRTTSEVVLTPLGLKFIRESVIPKLQP